MKTKRTTLVIMTAITMMAVMFHACKKNNGGPDDLNIVSMTAGEADLNSATSPSDVPVDATIEITFNTDIKAETATSNNITLVQDYDEAIIPIQITVNGPTLTIQPEAALGAGILYQLNLTSGLLNVDDQPLAQTSRTFTTAGTFTPAGIIANWTFENSAEDVVGNYDPTSNGIVDITYAASRNETAGQAAVFNGNTSIIEVPMADPLVETSDFTISFWMKTNSEGHVNENGDPAGHFVMGLGAFYGIQYEIFSSYEASKFAIRYEIANDPDSTTGEDMWFPSEATDNTNGGWQGWDYARSLTPTEMQGYLKDSWTQVTYTYDGTDKRGTLYFNGQIMKSFDFDLWPDGDAKQSVTGMTYAGSEPDVVNDLAFGFIHSRAGTMWDAEPWGGYDFDTANHFKGQLDDVKIYHKVLTETEVQLMYDSES